jgi:hypothetical protein
MRFAYSDVQQVVEDVATKSVLIGGQALNYWCEALNCVGLEPYKPFVSRDIDFMGSRDDAEACGKMLGVNPEYPAVGGTESREAWLEFNTSAGVCRLDFLRAPKGLTKEEVLKARVPVKTSGDQTIWILHPYHCLVCRVVNVAALPDQYANEHGLNQLRAAVVMVREFVSTTAVNSGARVAQDICNRVSDFALRHEAIHVYFEHGVDVFDAVPGDALSAAYRERARPRALEKIRKARERYSRGPQRVLG